MSNQTNNTQAKTDRAKIIERVKRLLAMGNDDSSTNEAAIAMKRARSLMDKHQVTMLDIEKSHKDDFSTEVFKNNSSRVAKWICQLGNGVALINDCKFLWAHGGGMEVEYKFQGFTEDSEVAKFMLSYLMETCLRAYKQNKEQLGLYGLRDRNDFLYGMADAINMRCYEIQKEREKQQQEEAGGTALIVAKTTAVKNRFRLQNLKVKSVDTSRNIGNEKSYLAGDREGKKVHLGAFVGDKNDKKAAIA